MISLYPHQVEFRDNLKKAFGKHKAIIGRAECGFGKTYVAADILKRAKGSTIMTVHRSELLLQTENSCEKFNIENPNIQMIQTLTRKEFKAPTLIIADEIHLGMSKSWLRVLEFCKENGSYILGLTATPERLDGRPLGQVFDCIVEGKDITWLIENKYLSEYEYYAPHIPTMKTTTSRDYATSDLLSVMNGKVLNDAISKWKKLALNKRTISFCCNVEHSKMLVAEAKKQGIFAVHIDGYMSKKDRKQAILDFSNNYGILSNVDICTTGFDLSAQIGRDITVECVMMLRPTKSYALNHQMRMRALRKKETKAIILDFAGNIFRHGDLIEKRNWSLEGKSKRESDALSIQRCPSCFHIQTPSPVCWSCGHVFQADSRVIEEIDGCLYMIDSNTWRDARREQVAKAMTLEELVAIEKARGYKSKWAENQYQAKHGNRPSIEETAKARGYSQGWIWQAKKRRK